MLRSAFTYGEESFNPALRPTNGQLRSRNSDSSQHADRSHYENRPNANEYVSPWHVEIGSDGEERRAGSDRSSSSPEPYLSDYDEENVGPLAPGERMSRVRRGSEGWEVKPNFAWNGQVATGVALEDDPEGRIGARPWEESGRYNVYEPYEPEDRADSNGNTVGRDSDDD